MCAEAPGAFNQNSIHEGAVDQSRASSDDRRTVACALDRSREPRRAIPA